MYEFAEGLAICCPKITAVSFNSIMTYEHLRHILKLGVYFLLYLLDVPTEFTFVTLKLEQEAIT